MMCYSGVLQIFFKLVFYSDFPGTSSGLIPYLTKRKRERIHFGVPAPFFVDLHLWGIPFALP